MKLYVLADDGRTPVEEPDLVKWGRWFENMKARIVVRTEAAPGVESVSPAQANAADDTAIIEVVIIVRIAILLETALRAVVKTPNNCGRPRMSPPRRFARR